MSCIENVIYLPIICFTLIIEPVCVATFIKTHDSIFHFGKHNIRLIEFKYLTMHSFNTFIAPVVLKLSSFHFDIPHSLALINVDQIDSVLVLFISVHLRIGKLHTFIIINDINLEHLRQFLYCLLCVNLILGDFMELL